MANINSVVLVGNLTKRPRAPAHAVRHAPCCSLRPRREHAAARTRRPASGARSRTTSTSRSGATRARTAAQYLAKGRRVGVQGRLEWREWEAQDGSKRQAVEVVADTVQFLDSRGDGEGGGGGGGSSFLPAESGGGNDADFPCSPADDDIPF